VAGLITNEIFGVAFAIKLNTARIPTVTMNSGVGVQILLFVLHF